MDGPLTARDGSHAAGTRKIRVDRGAGRARAGCTRCDWRPGRARGGCTRVDRRSGRARACRSSSRGLADAGRPGTRPRERGLTRVDRVRERMREPKCMPAGIMRGQSTVRRPPARVLGVSRVESRARRRVRRASRTRSRVPAGRPGVGRMRSRARGRGLRAGRMKSGPGGRGLRGGRVRSSPPARGLRASRMPLRGASADARARSTGGVPGQAGVTGSSGSSGRSMPVPGSMSTGCLRRRRVAPISSFWRMMGSSRAA